MQYGYLKQTNQTHPTKTYNLKLKTTKKSTTPKLKSSSTPHKQKNAKCIRQPQTKSNTNIILSRSSKAHNKGLNAPISNIIHETHNKPLKQRINSTNNTRKNVTRKAKQQRNKLSNAKTNICSLQTRLQ